MKKPNKELFEIFEKGKRPVSADVCDFVYYSMNEAVGCDSYMLEQEVYNYDRPGVISFNACGVAVGRPVAVFCHVVDLKEVSINDLRRLSCSRVPYEFPE